MPLSDVGATEDLADLYDNAPCAYLSLSPNAYIVKANRTLADWLDRDVDDLLSRPVHDLLSFGGRIAFETHLAPLLRLQGFVHELALDLIDVQGEKIPVIANAAEKRDADGTHLFTRLTMFKAVDRRTYERSLVEARIKAEAAAETEHRQAELRDQFIAVLGHDLRNPLAAIAAGIHLLRRPDATPDRVNLITSEMESSVARAHALINNVMDFTRGSLGSGIVLARDPARALAPLLEHLLAEQAAISPDRDLRKDIAIGHMVDCDPDRVCQLTANLLANAVAHGASDRPIILEAHTSEDRLIISVVNGGPPIPDAVREQLFQPFVRGAGVVDRRGLGLGLFIVREIAKAHRGTIEVTSTDDETRFTFAMMRNLNRDAPTI